MPALFTLRMGVGVVGDPPPLHDRRALRREIERQVETLLSALDDMDGDTDLEDDGSDEPYLGWTKHNGYGTTDDREEDPLDAGEDGAE